MRDRECGGCGTAEAASRQAAVVARLQMLKVERFGKRLVGFAGLQPKPIRNLYDITDFVVNSPAEFFGEIDEDLFVFGAELRSPDAEDDIVDLLAVDADGVVVIVVAAAEADSASLTRALQGAGRVASWRDQEFWDRLTPARAAALRSFLGVNRPDLNQMQRVVLIAEEYPEHLVRTADWLSRSFGIRIRLVEVALAEDPAANQEYLSCKAISDHGATVVEVEEPPEPAEVEPPPEQVEDAEGRRFARRVDLRAEGLQIEYANRRFPAGLMDYSPGGIGLVLNTPLPLESDIVVHGLLRTGEFKMRLDAAARVKYCKFSQRAFRIGLAFRHAQPEAPPSEAPAAN